MVLTRDGGARAIAMLRRLVPESDPIHDADSGLIHSADSVKPRLRFNTIVFFAHGLLGQTGFRLLQAPTILPAYIYALTGQELAVGLARAVQSLGTCLSPILGARLVERRTKVKALALGFGALMRSQVLCLAILALLASPQVAYVLLWPVVFVWGLASGLQMVVFNVLVAKIFPAHLRGRLLGSRNLASGVTLLLVSGAAGVLLNRFGYPRGYGWTFFVAFVLTSIGLAMFSLLREEGDTPTRPAIAWTARLREIPYLLGAERNFRRFITALLLSTTARGALPYYVVASSRSLDLAGSHLAGLTVAFTLSQAIWGLLWGLLGDRGGFRRVFIAALLCWASGTVVILSSSALWSVYLVFALVGCGFSGAMLAGQTLVLEFGGESERAMRIASTYTISEATGMIGFVGAGLLAQVSLDSVFAVSVALQGLAIAAMWRARDPRKPELPPELDADVA